MPQYYFLSTTFNQFLTLRTYIRKYFKIVTIAAQKLPDIDTTWCSIIPDPCPGLIIPYLPGREMTILSRTGGPQIPVNPAPRRVKLVMPDLLYPKIRKISTGTEIKNGTMPLWLSTVPSISLAMLAMPVYIMPLRRGSRASLRPSPTMLKPNTTSMRASPGAKERMGLVRR